jgi:hypothetical protein
MLALQRRQECDVLFDLWLEGVLGAFGVDVDV